MKKQFAVYIMASRCNGTLYTGMTSNLPQRVWQHKNKFIEEFTKKYDVNELVYFELHEDTESAIRRERRIKEWPRKWKIALIERLNKGWADLYEEIL